MVVDWWIDEMRWIVKDFGRQIYLKKGEVKPIDFSEVNVSGVL